MLRNSTEMRNIESKDRKEKPLRYVFIILPSLKGKAAWQAKEKKKSWVREIDQRAKEHALYGTMVQFLILQTNPSIWE